MSAPERPAVVASESQELIGEVLGPGYRIVAALGIGGMGVVYRAWDHTSDRYVVIKVPRRSVRLDPGFVTRFEREMEALRSLSHPNIVPIIDAGVHGSVPYAVMPYMAGGSLKKRRPTKGGKITPAHPPLLRRWLQPIASALDHVHAEQYVHRDVKPDNILFDWRANPFVADFGIAKIVRQSTSDEQTQGLTATGFALGTPDYMAPEVIDGRKPDGRADQYALAAVVYEVLAARRPIEGSTPARTMVAQLTQEPHPLGELRRDLPPSLCAAIHRALAKKAEKRFASCGEFAGMALLDVPDLPAPEKRRLMCPTCGELVGVISEWAGKNGSCPACKGLVFISPDLHALVVPAEMQIGRSPKIIPNQAVQALTAATPSHLPAPKHSDETSTSAATPPAAWWRPSRLLVAIGILVPVFAIVGGSVAWHQSRNIASTPPPADLVTASSQDANTPTVPSTEPRQESAAITEGDANADISPIGEIDTPAVSAEPLATRGDLFPPMEPLPTASENSPETEALDPQRPGDFPPESDDVESQMADDVQETTEQGSTPQAISSRTPPMPAPPNEIADPGDRDNRGPENARRMAQLQAEFAGVLGTYNQLHDQVRDCMQQIATLQSTHDSLATTLSSLGNAIGTAQRNLANVQSNLVMEESKPWEKQNRSLIQQMQVAENGLVTQITALQTQQQGCARDLQGVQADIQGLRGKGTHLLSSLDAVRPQCRACFRTTARDDLVAQKIALVKDALRTAPDFTECWAILALLSTYSGDAAGVEAALDACERLLSKHPFGPSDIVPFEYVYVRLMLGEETQVHQMMGALEKRMPNNPLVQHLQALCRVERNNFSGAATSFLQALKAKEIIDRGLLCGDAAWFFAASPVEASHNPGLAADLAEEALRLSNGTSWKAWRAKSVIFADNANWEEATTCLAKAIEYGPQILSREFQEQAEAYRDYQTFRIKKVTRR